MSSPKTNSQAFNDAVEHMASEIAHGREFRQSDRLGIFRELQARLDRANGVYRMLGLDETIPEKCSVGHDCWFQTDYSP